MEKKHLFYDESGKKIEFFIKGKFTLNNIDYAALQPADNGNSDIYILRIEVDENGEEILVGIDEDELEEARKAYEELIEEDLQ